MPYTLSIADTRAWLILLRTPGLGPAGLRKLIAEHVSASAAVDAALREADDDGRAWLRTPDERVLANDLTWIDHPRHHLVQHRLVVEIAGDHPFRGSIDAQKLSSPAP